MPMEKISVSCYVGILVQDSKYGARPLMAGVFSPVGANGLSESMLKQAATHNNIHLFSKKMVSNGGSKSLEEANSFYTETVTGAVLRYQEIFKSKCPSFPKLQLVVLSGPDFINQAVRRKLMKSDTLDFCKSLSSRAPGSVPLLSADGKPLLGESGKLPRDIDGTASTNAGSATGSSLPPPLPGVSQEDLDPVSTDPITRALELSGYQVKILQPGESAGEDTVGSQEGVGGGVPECEGDETLDEGEVLDVHRLVDEALLQVATLDPLDIANPVVKCLVSAVRRLEKSHKAKDKMLVEKDRKIMGLNQLTMTMEMRLQGFQESSSENISQGLLPKIKGAISDAQKEMTKELRKEMEVITSLLKESRGSSREEKDDGVKSSLTGLAARVAELKMATNDIARAASMIDQKLTASGFIVKDDSLVQVNVPEVLLQLNDKVNGIPPPSLPPAPLGDLSLTPRVTHSSGLKRQGPTTLSSTPSTTPGKKVRWDMTTPTNQSNSLVSIPKPGVMMSTSSAPGAVNSFLKPGQSKVLTSKSTASDESSLKKSKSGGMKPGAARSLVSQFNSTLGHTPASNPALWKSMLDAQEAFPNFQPPSLDQIAKRIEMHQAAFASDSSKE